jgi:hypothetical protein
MPAFPAVGTFLAKTDTNPIVTQFVGLEFLNGQFSLSDVGSGYLGVSLSPGTGGNAQVANVASLSALDDTGIINHSEVLVDTLLQRFQLDKSSTATVDGITVVATLSGTGRWLRILSPVPQWTNQSSWTQDSVLGNDENPGTPLSPLQTTAEFTRRVRVAKYSSSFTPYTLQLLNDVSVLNDSFQWSPQIQSTTGTLSTPLDTGVNSTLLTIRGTKTVIGAGVVTAAGTTISVTGNTKTTLGRLAGAYSVGDVIEFTSGAASGLRIYINEVTGGGLTGGFDPWNLGGTAAAVAAHTPVAGDTFNVVSLSKFGPQLNGILGVQGARIDLIDLTLPGPGGAGTGCDDYTIMDYVLRLQGVLSNIVISADYGGRIRWGTGVSGAGPTLANGSCMINSPTALFPTGKVWTIERGSIVLNTVTTANIVAIDVLNDEGRIAATGVDMAQGCFRRSGSGPTGVSNAGAGPTFGRLNQCRCWDYPTTVPANPFEGGAGDPGAALICRRTSQMQVRWLVGTSAHAGTSGMNIAEGSQVLLQDQAANPSTATGAASDLIIDAGAAIPSINPANGLPVAGAAITTWAGLAGAPYGGNAHNLVNGTRFINAA